jgi:hypothetical protein
MTTPLGSRALERVLVYSFLAGCIMVGASIMTEPPHLPRKGAKSKNLINARQLAAACRWYAADHQDRYPARFDELEPKYVPHWELEELRHFYASRRPENQMDWLYFGAGFDTNSPPRLLLASPQAVTIGRSPKRVVVSDDTDGSIVAESEYEQLLGETVRQIKALGQDHAERNSGSTAARQSLH